MSHIRLLVALVALLFIASMSLAQDEPRKPDQPQEPDDQVKEKAEPAPEEEPEEVVLGERPITVTLIEAGSEPLRTLQYNLSAGDTQQFVVAHRNTTTQVVLGMRTPPTRDPDFRATVESRVASVDDDGTVTASLRILKAEAVAIGNAPPPAAGHLAAMRAMDGATARLKMNRRGVVESIGYARNLSGPAGLLVGAPHEVIEQAIRTAIIPLPQEPVGVGAQWRVEEATRSGGIIRERTTMYTITRLDEDQIELDAQTSFTAVAQPIDVDMQTALKLNSYAGKIKGRDVISLNRMVPDTLERNGTIDMEIQVNVHRMTQHVESVASIKPHADDAPEDDERQEDQ